MEIKSENPIAQGEDEPKAQIGILLVHGIGDQQPGETLINMGEPLVNWLSDWLQGLCRWWKRSGLNEGSLNAWFMSLRDELNLGQEQSPEKELQPICNIGEIEPVKLQLTAHHHGAAIPRDWLDKYELMDRYLEEIEQAKDPESLKEALRGNQILDAAAEKETPFVISLARVVNAELNDRGNSPANMRVRIETLNTKAELQREDWLFCEAHWAQSFMAPSPARVALWSALVCVYLIPSICIRQLKTTGSAVTGKRPDIPRILGLPRMLAALAMVLAIPLLTLVAQATFLLLAVLSMIPLQFIRKKLIPLQYVLSSVIGDSYVILESAINHAAVVECVKQNLAWLTSRCRNVVIVAHSQGAYVTLKTLENYLPRDLRLLVTFGSGIERLATLKQLHTNRGIDLKIASVLWWSFLYWSADFMIGAWHGSFGIWSVAMRVITFLALAFIIVGGTRSYQATINKGWESLLRDRKIRWLDYFTAEDPVPNGSPSLTMAARQTVTNFSSVLLDHNSYMANRDQFIPSVVNAIARAGESYISIDRLSNRDSGLLETGARWRPYRLAWLRAGLWTATLCAIALVLRYRGEFGQWGLDLRKKMLLAQGFLHTTVLNPLISLPQQEIGAGLLVLSWAAACLALVIFWFLWARRDANWMADRKIPTIPILQMQSVVSRTFLMIKYLYIYALILTLAVFSYFKISFGSVFGAKLFWVILATSGVASVLQWFLDKMATHLNADIIKRRRRTLIPQSEAVKLAGWYAYENSPKVAFDAMAYCDAMYSDEPLVYQDDLLRCQEDVRKWKEEAKP